MTEHRLAEIRRRIEVALSPTALEIVDESHKHVGHAGARDGRGHFAVKVTSERFTDLRPLQRHKLVYEAVGDLMDTDIHALSIETSTPAADT